MDAILLDWLNLALRWIHVVAAISWIGSSFYFMWLDSHLDFGLKSDGDVIGSLWMVHSGGFYRVEKHHLSQGKMPKTLHWFKWEALLTLLTGFPLLILIYYYGELLVDPDSSSISFRLAALTALGLFAGSWLIYDTLWNSPLTKRRELLLFISFAWLAVLAFGLCQLLAPRAGYLHFGGILGTLMVANVWMRILPAQRQMIEATEKGKTRDLTLAERAKERSIHNSYLTLPVIFTMLSHHYPATYGHSSNWIVLILISGVGITARHALLVKTQRSLWLLLLSIASAISLTLFTQ